MSRRKRRYENRKKLREAKKAYLKENDNFNNLISAQALYKATLQAGKGVMWKASTQRYLLTALFRNYDTKQALLKNKNICRGFIEFTLNERGKERHIKSVHFSERVVQKSLCTNALYPVLSRGLIYDNSASQKGKGTHFAIERMTLFLRKYYKKYKNNGYILKIDFKSYFENIAHEPLKEQIKERFTDERVLHLSDVFIDAFGAKGLGLGSETSQINAVLFVNKIDHWLKEVAGCKYYCRYMDDSIILHHSKEELQRIYKELLEKFKYYDIKVNTKKTHICKLKQGFTFLKTRFLLTDTGKVVRKPSRKAITYERRKLKKQAKLFKNGILTLDEILQSYTSWRGSMMYRTARKTVHNMDLLFDRLFKTEKGVQCQMN